MTDGGSTTTAGNPFANVTVNDLQLLERLQNQFLATALKPQFYAERLAGRALVSANLFGGLNDPACWQGWLGPALNTKERKLHEVIEFEFQQAATSTSSRLWIPDAVTGVILNRLRDQIKKGISNVATDIDAVKGLEHALDFLAKMPGADLGEVATLGPAWFVRTCTARLHMRVPSLLAEHASGRTVTHARIRTKKQVHPTKQLYTFLASAKTTKVWRPEIKDPMLYHLRSGFFPVTQEAVEASRKLGDAMRAALDKQIKGWTHVASGHCLHSQMLLWLRLRLDPSDQSKVRYQSRIRPSTARNYLFILGSIDWGSTRMLSIHEPECVSGIAATFDKILENLKSQPAEHQGTPKAVVRSFSHFLNAANPDVAVYQGSAGPRANKRPRLDVLDTHDFTALVQMLAGWGAAKDCTRRSKACQLAAILMFRTGLRGQEVTNLALNDTEFAGDLVELVVRGSANQSNKTIYSRRTLPLHVLLAEAELSLLRQVHARRCDEEFHTRPRAKLFQLPPGEPLRLRQYLLEPIDAVIRVLLGRPPSEKTTRKETGYWYALASPLRHSFANHLFATLLLPEDRLNIPLPSGLTADLVSVPRKRKLSDALLRQGQIGLSAMQAIRYAMGHAGHKRALETYIHNVDWILAAHLWRDNLQPRLTFDEMVGFLGRKPTFTVGKTVTDRHQRRQRAREAERNPASALAVQPKRGRPTKKQPVDTRSTSIGRGLFLHHYVDAAEFGTNVASPATAAIEVDHGSDLAWPDRGWWALHHLLKMRSRSMNVSETAQYVALPVDTCQRWLDRAKVLSDITNTGGQSRFPQMSLEGFNIFHSKSPGLLDGLWAQRDQLSHPRLWKRVVELLSRWQADPPLIRSPKGIIRLAKLYADIGIPPNLLVMRHNGGLWQPYASKHLTSEKGQDFQLTAAMIAGGIIKQHLHHTILYGLLMMAIDGSGDLDDLNHASSLRKRNRPPQRLREPVRRSAKVSVRITAVSG